VHYIGDCIPCQYGAHDEHQNVPGPVPEGVIGGWICDCKGECRDRPRPKATFIEAEPMPPETVEMLDFLRRASEAQND
jgi:hypothetical protein